MVETTADGRKLGPLLATAIVAGNMIGSGVYLLPATLAGIGSISLIGWAASGAGALVLAGAFAILARVHTADGGLVGYVRDAFGRFFGLQAAWLYAAECVIGNVALALAATGSAAFFFPVLKGPWPSALTTVGVIWALTGAAILGPRTIGRIGAGTLTLGLVPVLAIAVLGWFWFDPAVLKASWNVSGHSGPVAVQSSMLAVFWAYMGLECANALGPVVRDPKRNIPIAALGGVALASAIYIAAMAAIMGIVPAAELAGSTAPFALAAQRTLGPALAAVVAVCALIKVSGTLGGWVLVTGETMRSAADEGVIPPWFGKVRADGTPVRSLVVLGVLMSGLALATLQPTLGRQFGVLINASAVLSLVVYALCAAALWRFSGALAGGRKAGARAIAVAAAVFSIWVAVSAGPPMVEFAAGAAAAGGLLWLLMLRRLRLAAA
jgi:arginine:agmatine antiporter